MAGSKIENKSNFYPLYLAVMISGISFSLFHVFFQEGETYWCKVTFVALLSSAVATIKVIASATNTKIFDDIQYDMPRLYYVCYSIIPATIIMFVIIIPGLSFYFLSGLDGDSDPNPLGFLVSLVSILVMVAMICSMEAYMPKFCSSCKKKCINLGTFGGPGAKQHVSFQCPECIQKYQRILSFSGY